MKKVILIGLIMAMGLMSISAFADAPQTPMLISAPIEVEVPKVGIETIGGFFISYENQTLTIEVRGREYPVTFFDKDKIIERDYPFIKTKDFIEVSAEYGEATFYLLEVTGFSPIMDGGMTPPLKKTNATLSFEGNIIESDVGAQLIDGTMMVPFRSTLEAMGYEVTWNSELRSIEIKKGPQWTSIKIGENSYFKNRMAPRPLSKEPLIVDGRTLVPVEFFVEIIGKNISVENGDITFKDTEFVKHTGFIKEMNYEETGGLFLVLVQSIEDEGMEGRIVIHTSKAYTYIQSNLEIGDSVVVISPMMMTASMPPQTSGYVVYEVK